MEMPDLSAVIYANNKEIQLANYKALLAAREAVQGYEVDSEDFPMDGISPAILSASPSELAEYFRQWCDDRIEMLLLDKGITPEMVTAEIPIARHELNCSLAKAVLETPSDQIKQEVQGVAGYMGIIPPLVFKIHGKTASVVGGSIVAYSPQKLQKLAPTPRRRKAVYAHELTHRKNQDALHKIAIRKAFEKAGKDDEYTNQLAHEISRAKEVTCDFTGGSLCLEYAQHFERLWNIPDTQSVAATHPRRIHRKNIATSLAHVHRLHNENKRKKERPFTSQAGKRLRELTASDLNAERQDGNSPTKRKLQKNPQADDSTN